MLTLVFEDGRVLRDYPTLRPVSASACLTTSTISSRLECGTGRCTACSRTGRGAFSRVKRLDLGVSEIFRELAGNQHAIDDLGRVAVGELRMIFRVRGAAQIRLTPGDQHAVLGRHHIGLDEIGPELNRIMISFERRDSAIREKAGTYRKSGVFACHAGEASALVIMHSRA